MVSQRIKMIRQESPQGFMIEWLDGKVDRYTLTELQKACPCAACVDESTGLRRIPAEEVPAHLSAIKIESVGRYALRVQFTSGCSRGIFGFDYLRGLKGMERK
jgi:DUF971 family protein